MARPAVPSKPGPAKPPARPAAPKIPDKQKQAAKPAANPDRRRRPSRAGGARKPSAGRVLSAAVLFLSVAALPVCVLLVVGMLPSIVAYIVDQTPRRTLTLTVGPMNLAGTAPYCLQLWFGTNTLRGLGLFLNDAWVWLVMYLAAAAGWLLFFGMPVIVHFLLERSIDRRKARLVQIQKKLRRNGATKSIPRRPRRCRPRFPRHENKAVPDCTSAR
ncbi:MAG: hypothetical protein WDN69_12610 [Aliidongia sp.]